MKDGSKFGLITATVIGLVGVDINYHTRDDVADAVANCTEEVHESNQCKPLARTSGVGFWDVLVVFSALGWGAGAFGYFAGERDAEERERKRLVDQAARKAQPMPPDPKI